MKERYLCIQIMVHVCGHMYTCSYLSLFLKLCLSKLVDTFCQYGELTTLEAFLHSGTSLLWTHLGQFN